MFSLLSSLRAAVRPSAGPSSVISSPAAVAVAARQTRAVASVGLGSIRGTRGSRKPKIRYGRGEGQKTGEGDGKGTKGAKSRAGGFKGPRAYEGGQTPVTQLYPKHGFFNAGRKFYQPVSLGTIQDYIDLKRLDPTETITVEHIFKSNLTRGFKSANGFKLLSAGFEKLRQPIHIRPHRASIAAIKAVEATGGSVTTVYHNKLSFAQACKPERFEGHLQVREALPMKKRDILYYTNWEKRGYLAKKPETVEEPEKTLSLLGLHRPTPRR